MNKRIVSFFFLLLFTGAIYAAIDITDLRTELQARIDKAREEIKSGKCVTLKSSEDIDAYFDSL